MKLAYAFRIAAAILLLPAVGVAVAATSTLTDDAALPQLETPSAELPAPSTDASSETGIQDDGTRANWIWLDDQGQLRGRISTIVDNGALLPVAGLPVQILSEGQVKYEAVTNTAGEFSLRGVQPGVYSLVGRNAAAIVSFGFYAFPARNTATGTESDLQIDTLAISSSSRALVDTLVRQNIPGIALGADSTQLDLYAKISRQSFYLPAAAQRVNVYELSKHAEDLPKSTGLSHHAVLAADGRLTGSLNQIFGSPVVFGTLRAYLVRGGGVVAEANVGDDGTFEFTGVRPGSYGFVAAGAGGMSAMGIEVTNVPAEEAADVAADGFQYVSTNKAQPVSSLSVALIAQDDTPAVDPDIVIDDAGEDAPPPGPGGAPGGPMGGGGGGGGGPGGGGGAGVLLGLAAGVGLGFALENDNNNLGGLTPVSPFGR